MSCRALSRRLHRLELSANPRRFLSEENKAWMHANCGEDADWLIAHVEKVYSGEFWRSALRVDPPGGGV